MTLSDAKIGKLKPPKSGYVIHWDAEFTRLGLRITEADGRAWIYDYTAAGKRRRMTLGQWPTMREAVARQLASAKAAEVRSGRDPLADREQAKIELEGAPTMADLARDWTENYAVFNKRPSSQINDKLALRKHILPVLGEHAKVADLTYQQVEALHRRIVKQGHPIMANRVIALVHAMFKRAIKKGWCNNNPASGIQRSREEHRERYLSFDEMERLQVALAESNNRQSARAIALMLSTGARRGEVLSATWSQFDLERGVWTKPSSHTKQKRPHMTPLNAPAMRVLSEMWAERQGDSVFLFPGEPGQPQQDLKKFWHRIRTAASIPDVHLHDLRHTFASYCVAKGLPLFVVGKLLGHSSQSTTARYSHLDLTVLREATNTVGALLSPK